MEKINKNLLLLEKKKKGKRISEKEWSFFILALKEFDLRVKTYTCPRGRVGSTGYVSFRID